MPSCRGKMAPYNYLIASELICMYFSGVGFGLIGKLATLELLMCLDLDLCNRQPDLVRYFHTDPMEWLGGIELHGSDWLRRAHKNAVDFKFFLKFNNILGKVLSQDLQRNRLRSRSRHLEKRQVFKYLPPCAYSASHWIAAKIQRDHFPIRVHALE